MITIVFQLSLKLTNVNNCYINESLFSCLKLKCLISEEVVFVKMNSREPRSPSNDWHNGVSEEEEHSDSQSSSDDEDEHTTNDHKRHGDNNHRNDEHKQENNEHEQGNYKHRRDSDKHGPGNDRHGRHYNPGGRITRTHNHRHKKNPRHSYKTYSKAQGSEIPLLRLGRMERSTVHMPSGVTCEITQPVLAKWRCGDKTKLITLNPRGVMGKREYKIVENEMQQTIMHHTDCKTAGGCFTRYQIVKIEKVVQGCVWRKYQNRLTDVTIENRGNANEKMLFHGTPEVYSIITEGFDERKANDGKLGSGIYFTSSSSAANQFVFGFYGGDGCKRHKNKNCYICERQLLLCRVTLGRSENFKSSSVGQMMHPKPGYHSAHGIPGEGGYDYEEYAIYRGEQAYPQYLITYKIVQ